MSTDTVSNTDTDTILSTFKSKNDAYDSKMSEFNSLLKEYTNLSTYGMTGMAGNIYGHTGRNGLLDTTGLFADTTNNTFDMCLNECQGNTGCHGASFTNSTCYKSIANLSYTDIHPTTNVNDSAIVPKQQFYQFQLNNLITELQRLNTDRATYYNTYIVPLNLGSSYNMSASSFSNAKTLLDSLNTTFSDTLENVSDTHNKQYDSYLTAEQEKTRFQFLLVVLCFIMYFTFTYLELSSTIAILFLLLGGALAFMLIVTQLIY
jgi:hypothetical protein